MKTIVKIPKSKLARGEGKKSKPQRRENGHPKPTRKPSARKLIVEMRGGAPYEYYPLGKHIVAAPGVCGGRPTFKYTRIEAAFILDLMRAGWTVADLVEEYASSKLTAGAIREALFLAKKSLVSTSSVTSLSV